MKHSITYSAQTEGWNLNLKDAQLTTLLRTDVMLIHLTSTLDFFKAPTVVCHHLPPAYIAL